MEPAVRKRAGSSVLLAAFVVGVPICFWHLRREAADASPARPIARQSVAMKVLASSAQPATQGGDSQGSDTSTKDHRGKNANDEELEPVQLEELVDPPAFPIPPRLATSSDRKGSGRVCLST